jgi:hypothetical protein
MKTPYLAIFKLQPEIIPKIRQMIQNKDEKEKILGWAEKKKITEHVNEYLIDNPDKKDISWWVNDAIMSELFFSHLDPNEKIPFAQRIPLLYTYEDIILPNGKWFSLKSNYSNEKKVLEQYKQDFLFVFFSIDF